MKALVKREGRPGLWMEEVPVPTCGPKDVLIKTKKSSICGTDVHIYKWDAWAQKTIPIPMIVGHEFMGEIAAVGSDVKTVRLGDRVSGEGHVVCGTCPQCRVGAKHLCVHTKGLGVNRPGSFAEFFTLPAENVFPLPPSVSDDVAAIFDPYGNAVHTALSFELTARDVLITGAGPIGIMSAAIAIKAGARHVVLTDLNDYRLQLAKQVAPLVHTVNISSDSLEHRMKELHISHGFDVGLEMSGHPSGLNTLLEKLTHGGKAALLGILPPGTVIDWDLVVFKMLTLKGIYGREIFSTWHQMTRLIESGLDLRPLITHRYKIDEFEKGFQAMLSGQSGKVLLDWA